MTTMNKKIEINDNRLSIDEAYMQMAEIWAKRSKANRKQVGALIVKNKSIISDGYNGMPSGDLDDVCEYYDEHNNLKTKSETLHAESNALSKLSKNSGAGADNSTLYVTMSPCFECAKLIKQAEISRVVFREQYRDTSGIDFLKVRGICVDKL
jgi:dCMP deaminase